MGLLINTVEKPFQKSLLVFFGLLFYVSTSSATLFQNAYVSFELPPNWSCQLDGTEWTCSSKYEKNTKEAIIILTAKEAGPNDTLANYETVLKASRPRLDSKGQTVNSKVLSVKTRQVANHPWIDALHLGSEINSYYTRYLATIKNRLAIAVTFSAHKSHYTKYSNDFLKSVESLKLIASKDLLANKPNLNQRGQGESFGTPGGLGIPTAMETELPPEPNSGSKLTQWIAIALLISAAGVFFWRRKKK